MNIYRGRTHTEVYLASVLYDSIEDQNISAVTKLLVEKRADPNIILPRKGISCFHLVIGNDCAKFAMEVTLLIIENGGDPNVLSDEGLTPVHIAAAWGSIDILRLLLNCGGDPELTDNFYKNALHYAEDENWNDAITLIKDFISYQRISIYSNCDTKAPYTIILDKILLNNGNLIGEYTVLQTENYTKPQMDLNTLPQTDSQEYVLNWCNNELDCDSMNSDAMCASELAEYYNGNVALMELRNSSHSSKASSSKSDYKNEGLSHYRRSFQSSIELRTNTSRPIPNAYNNVTVRNKTKYDDNCISKDICKYKESSRESGIMTLQDSSEEDNVYLDNNTKKEPYSPTYLKIVGEFENLEIEKTKDTSSDYFTCTEGSESLNILDKTIYDFSQGNTVKSNCANEDSDIVSVSEVYKYTDAEEDVVLYEKRILVASTKGSQNGSITTSSSLCSLPKSFTYDTDTLRKELTMRGFVPGPITKTTKRVYLRKLYQLKKQPLTIQLCKSNEIVYSTELQKTLKDTGWYQNLSQYQHFEELLKKQFTTPDPTRKWREGTAKSSFTYLLLDPRITQNLPHRCEQLQKSETWSTFLSSIFYVGKGKRSRPYSHFYEAVGNYNKPDLITDSTKINRILDIWKDNHGVICLHVFQNVIPVEAYTREAAMISALKLENITNIKSGEFYGVSVAWNQKQRNLLGVYLLYKAMKIFLNEGERQLYPNDIE